MSTNRLYDCISLETISVVVSMMSFELKLKLKF